MTVPPPSVSNEKSPGTVRRADLTDSSWPFLGSIALHAVALAIFSIPAFNTPSAGFSPTPTLFLLNKNDVPDVTAQSEPMPADQDSPSEPQSEAAESVMDDVHEAKPRHHISAVPLANAEIGSDSIDTQMAIARPEPVTREKNDTSRHLVPAPENSTPQKGVATAMPVVAGPEPQRRTEQKPTGQTPAAGSEAKPAIPDEPSLHKEADAISRRTAEQSRYAAEQARQAQLAREQAEQARAEQKERDRAAAERARAAAERQRLEQVAQEKAYQAAMAREEAARKLEQERSAQEHKRKLAAAEQARQAQLTREQAEQARAEQKERDRVAAERARAAAERQRLEQVAQKKAYQAAMAREEAARKLEQERSAQEHKRRLLAAAEQARQAQLAREQEQRARAEQKERDRMTAEKARAADEKLRMEQAAAQEKEHRDSKAREEAARKLQQERVAQQAPPPVIKARVQKKDSGQSRPQQSKAMALPLLKGNLKLVITGTAPPTITIRFRAFALNRRNRPFSRAEARNETRLSPLVATRENIREVVIEQTNPGIYTIVAEPAGGPADAVFSLKLYEGTPRTISRDLGRQTIDRRKTLQKILMPDGILWDDNRSFTGNMEDSEGITKFNAETGLVWKEYAE